MSPRFTRPARGFLASLVAVLAALLCASPASATWSIVVVDKDTGEIGVASATCLSGFDLVEWVPLMLVGVGGAAMQSSLDSGAANRMIIWNELLQGTLPEDIENIIINTDPDYGSRQFGIVNIAGNRETFTGNRAGDWAGGVRGASGSLAYAIQGNVLTGEPVITEAEQALTGTPGDLAERLMAAMEAAYAMGGDGRCSCPGDPTGCGSPPADFDKSAHVGFMLISRSGDLDGICDPNLGCANGLYYLSLNVARQAVTAPDPVIQLREQFDEWRNEWRGRPDHVLTTVEFSERPVPGNGTRRSQMTVVLLDWEGTALGTGGATLSVSHAEDSAGLTAIGPAVDNGDGTYEVELTAGAGQGLDVLRIVVDDGLGPVQLYPDRKFRHVETLVADLAEFSAAAGGTVNFTLSGPDAVPGRAYLVAASASGNSPGLPATWTTIPLNFDVVFVLSLRDQNGPNFVDTAGFLDVDGSGTARFEVGAGDLGGLVGGQLDFALLALDPLDFASNPVTLTVLP